MRRVIFSTFVLCMFVGMLPAPAASLEAGSDGFTYVYTIKTDPATGPWREFNDFIEGQFTQKELAAKYKGFPSQTVGKSDIYFMPDYHLTAVVYYNAAGASTIILLIPDSMTTYPAGKLP